MNLEIQWNSFDDYLFSLRHHYRRKILSALKKIGQSRPNIMKECEYNHKAESPALVLSEPDEYGADEFFKNYLAVMKRTPTKLETLNAAFFEKLFLQKADYKLLNLVVKGKIISSAVLIFENDALIFMLVGRENEKDEYDSYFNLVYGIIALAIQSGSRKLKMGQTAYWVKQCAGALPETERIYFASRRPFVHGILKLLRHVIFPELKLKPVDVFRKPGNLTEPTYTDEQYHFNI
jgi:predicted N-acyltransferase